VSGVRADRFCVTVSGAGSVGVSGTAAQLEASLTGAGDANLEHLVTRDTRVVVTGTGTATVYATRSLDAVASGPGAVVYHGHPAQVTRTAGGPGTVEAA